jgi:catechol 2,3-dioxygenase-like lactoylglutathione lyase family enzyme
MKPVIDHVQITVKDMSVALPFYDQLMPLLGFDLEKRINAVVGAHELHVVEYIHPQLGFGINSPREPFAQETVHRRKPGALHHLAFKVESKSEVDRLAGELEKIGANVVDGPGLFPQHGSDYYAVFFKDPDGIKYEIVCSGT